MKKSKIEIAIDLDENQVPEQIQWEATDGLDGQLDAKAMLLALWDKKDGAAMRIDLWTKEMTVDEMKMFYYQCMMTMADTFERATNESQMAKDMKEFTSWYAEQMKLDLG